MLDCGYIGRLEIEHGMMYQDVFHYRYLDNLVGPYPESKQVFEDRSALRHVNAITCPILLLHGEFWRLGSFTYRLIYIYFWLTRGGR